MKIKKDKVIAFLVFMLTLILSLYLYFKGAFTSEEVFKQVIDDAGVFGWLLFILMCVISNVILFMPCMLGYPVGTICFGSFKGFVLNYIATLLAGAVIYFITHKYGVAFVQRHTSKRVYDKYEKLRHNTKKSEILLAVTLLLPVFPDNIISYIVSLSDMKFHRYMIIYILCKPWKLLMYAYGYDVLFDFIKTLF